MGVQFLKYHLFDSDLDHLPMLLRMDSQDGASFHIISSDCYLSMDCKSCFTSETYLIPLGGRIRMLSDAKD